jgi:hypothetical protein
MVDSDDDDEGGESAGTCSKKGIVGVNIWGLYSHATQAKIPHVKFYFDSCWSMHLTQP